jgi:hypothetical protein
MTIEIWRECLQRYAEDGNPSEQLMATMLLAMTHSTDPNIVRMFDMYASQILEAS